MDFFKKGQAMLNSNKNHASGSGQHTTTTTGQPAEQKQDYGDKAAEFLAKKSGHPVNRETNEKITDGARGLYEKFTGKKVNPKYSN